MKTVSTLGVATLFTAFVLSGCSAGASPRSEVRLSSRDGAIWVRPEDIDLYVCTNGVFVCESAFGRTSDRFCRCAAP